MTIAAAQCREYIEATYPGTPISRYACRDTASGNISQHSAFGSPRPDWTDKDDSNALDIFGPSKTSGDDDQAWIQAIVDDLTLRATKFSIRQIVWRYDAAHQNHAHVDFYPYTITRQWCGGPEDPQWRNQYGVVITSRNPEPQNGRYNGKDDPMWGNDITDLTWMTMFHSNVPRVHGFGRYYCTNDGTYDWDADPFEQLHAPWGSNPHPTAPDGQATYDEKLNALNHLLQGFSIAAGKKEET